MGRGARVAPARAVGTVTPERWQQIKGIVATAIETPRDERNAYVAHACAGDAELRAEVDSLLVAADDTGSLPGARRAIADAAEQSILASALGQQYEIVRQLGRGGMGAVYLARERSLERFVAIKVLRPELAAVIGADRFLAEIKTTANLQHPHILPLFDSGVAESFLFYVMPFIEGETVRDRLTREKQLPVSDAVRIASEVAAALDYAHRRPALASWHPPSAHLW